MFRSARLAPTNPGRQRRAVRAVRQLPRIDEPSQYAQVFVQVAELAPTVFGVRLQRLAKSGQSAADERLGLFDQRDFIQSPALAIEPKHATQNARQRSG